MNEHLLPPSGCGADMTRFNNVYCFSWGILVTERGLRRPFYI